MSHARGRRICNITPNEHHEAHGKSYSSERLPSTQSGTFVSNWNFNSND